MVMIPRPKKTARLRLSRFTLKDGLRPRNPSCLTPTASIDRGELLDAQAGADAADQLFGVVDDADRVFVVGRAALHISPAFGCGRKIVDQELDLVAIGIV